MLTATLLLKIVNMENLLGVVLCGGASNRMGTDKGLIKKDDRIWAQIVGDNLHSVGLEVAYSISSQQLQPYEVYISSDRLIVDVIDIQGPLKGLLSAYTKYSHRDILLMACDLIEMDQQTLSVLVGHYQSNPEFDFFAYQHEFAEPLCAIYTSKGLRPILEKAQKHQLTKFSFQNILDEGNTLRLPVLNKNSFKNYNTLPGHHRE